MTTNYDRVVEILDKEAADLLVANGMLHPMDVEPTHWLVTAKFVKTIDKSLISYSMSSEFRSLARQWYPDLVEATVTFTSKASAHRQASMAKRCGLQVETKPCVLTQIGATY